MAKKYKLTGCAKFFIFFIIAAPIAYVGASYYNGQDPVKEVREFFLSFTEKNDEPSGSTVTRSPEPNGTNGTVYNELELKELKIKNLEGDLKDCKDFSARQTKVIEDQRKEIIRLQEKSPAGN